MSPNSTRLLTRNFVVVILSVSFFFCARILMSDDIDNVIDGSEKEGGGQVLRVSVSLATVLKESLRVFNIRGGRPQPGLRAQHLTGLELVKMLTPSSTFQGLNKGSTRIDYWPGPIAGGKHKVLCPTAGSVTLILQAAFPCALFAASKTEVFVRGGTNVPFSPPVEYTDKVFLPLTRKLGIASHLEIQKRGYNPEGGGVVTMDIDPVHELKPLDLTNLGQVTKLTGEIYVSNRLPSSIVDNLKRSASATFSKLFPELHFSWIVDRPDHSDVCGISLFAESINSVLGATQLIGRRDDPLVYGKKAAEELLWDMQNGVCLDRHSQDQIIVLVALAKGKSRIRVGEITQHTQTAISIVQKITKAKFSVVKDGSTNIIECDGIGLINKNL